MTQLKVTLEEGGTWLTLSVAPDVAVQILNTGNLAQFGPSKVYAVQFPGDIIYDFVNEKWRYREWSSSTDHDMED